MDTKYIYIGINTESGEIISSKAPTRIAERIGICSKTITRNAHNKLSENEYNGWRITKVIIIPYRRK